MDMRLDQDILSAVYLFFSEHAEDLHVIALREKNGQNCQVQPPHMTTTTETTLHDLTIKTTTLHDQSNH
jgi:hypothetical protein